MSLINYLLVNQYALLIGSKHLLSSMVYILAAVSCTFALGNPFNAITCAGYVYFSHDIRSNIAV